MVWMKAYDRSSTYIQHEQNSVQHTPASSGECLIRSTCLPIGSLHHVDSRINRVIFALDYRCPAFFISVFFGSLLFSFDTFTIQSQCLKYWILELLSISTHLITSHHNTYAKLRIVADFSRKSVCKDILYVVQYLT